MYHPRSFQLLHYTSLTRGYYNLMTYSIKLTEDTPGNHFDNIRVNSMSTYTDCKTKRLRTDVEKKDETEGIHKNNVIEK